VQPAYYELQHPTLRDCLVTVTTLGRPLPDREGYGRAGRCPRCGQPHRHKTYHLQLDARGRCVVTAAVHQQLQRAGAIAGAADQQLALLGGGRRHPRLKAPFVSSPAQGPARRAQRIGGPAPAAGHHGPGDRAAQVHLAHHE